MSKPSSTPRTPGRIVLAIGPAHVSKLAVAAGANLEAVQQMLGHASAAMTLAVYAGLFADDLDAVAERLDAAVSRAGPASDADFAD